MYLLVVLHICIRIVPVQLVMDNVLAGQGGLGPGQRHRRLVDVDRSEIAGL